MEFPFSSTLFVSCSATKKFPRFVNLSMVPFTKSSFERKTITDGKFFNDSSFLKILILALEITIDWSKDAISEIWSLDESVSEVRKIQLSVSVSDAYVISHSFWSNSKCGSLITIETVLISNKNPVVINPLLNSE